MLGKCISGIRISKILLEEDPDPRMGFATSVLAGSGSTRHGLPPKAKNPSYAPLIPETGVFQGADSEDFVIVDCTVLVESLSVSDGETDGQIPLRQLRQGISIAA